MTPWPILAKPAGWSTEQPNRWLWHTPDSSAAIHYQQDETTFVQLHTPTSEQSIAIEPMTCPADAFNNQIGLLTLSEFSLKPSPAFLKATYQSK